MGECKMASVSVGPTDETLASIKGWFSPGKLDG